MSKDQHRCESCLTTSADAYFSSHKRGRVPAGYDMDTGEPDPEVQCSICLDERDVLAGPAGGAIVTEIRDLKNGTFDVVLGAYPNIKETVAIVTFSRMPEIDLLSRVAFMWLYGRIEFVDSDRFDGLATLIYLEGDDD